MLNWRRMLGWSNTYVWSNLHLYSRTWLKSPTFQPNKGFIQIKWPLNYLSYSMQRWPTIQNHYHPHSKFLNILFNFFKIKNYISLIFSDKKLSTKSSPIVAKFNQYSPFWRPLRSIQTFVTSSSLTEKTHQESGIWPQHKTEYYGSKLFQKTTRPDP